MRFFIGLLTVLICLATTKRALAQESWPLTMEVRGGVTLPAPDIVDGSSGGPARSIRVVAEYRLWPALSLYGGYTSYALQPRRDYTQEGSGFDLGARLSMPIGEARSLWFRGGMILHRLEATFPGSRHPTRPVTSEWSSGGEIGVGLGIPTGRGLVLTPGLSYQSYLAEMDISEVFESPGSASKIRTQYLTLDLGLQFDL
jgi:hypothetical protein